VPRESLANDAIMSVFLYVFSSNHCYCHQFIHIIKGLTESFYKDFELCSFLKLLAPDTYVKLRSLYGKNRMFLFYLLNCFYCL
jgi:hypothetical protein